MRKSSSAAAATQSLVQADVDGQQMNGRCKADARAGSDKSLHIYLYTNKARCVTGRLSESHINRQRFEGTGRDERARVLGGHVGLGETSPQECWAGAYAFVRRRR